MCNKAMEWKFCQHSESVQFLLLNSPVTLFFEILWFKLGKKIKRNHSMEERQYWKNIDFILHNSDVEGLIQSHEFR